MISEKDIKEYQRAVQYLESFNRIPRQYEYMRDRGNPAIYLKRMEYFLKLIGNPQKGFKYVHVSGTAGKGSVSTMIHDSMVNAGKNAGLVTSPFVTTTIEKTKVGGKYISPADFIRILDSIKPAIDKAYTSSPFGGPSYFETLLAISLVYFKEQKCEWIVLEVGCGGRFDYTNVTGPRTISVITNIGLDHVELIGPTLSDIAYEKAGIIKKDGVFLTTEKRPELREIFQKECQIQNAECVFLEYSGGYRSANNALVSSVGRLVGIDDSHVQRALDNYKLPCRFEIVETAPTVILDGAHNNEKIKSTIENLQKLDYKKCILVFACGSDKDAKGMLKKLLPHVSEVIITRATTSPKSVSNPKLLYDYVKKNKKSAKLFIDPFQALEYARKKAGEKSAEKSGEKNCVLVTGSFFLSGELRTIWYPEEYILNNRKSF